MLAVWLLVCCYFWSVTGQSTTLPPEGLPRVPLAPTNVGLQPVHYTKYRQGLLITWQYDSIQDPVPVTSFRVEVRTVGPWMQLGDVNSKTRQFEWMTMSRGVHYAFRVTALSADNIGGDPSPVVKYSTRSSYTPNYGEPKTAIIMGTVGGLVLVGAILGFIMADRLRNKRKQKAAAAASGPSTQKC